MVKNGYYGNEYLDLVRDRIKVHQMTLFITTGRYNICNFRNRGNNWVLINVFALTNLFQEPLVALISGVNLFCDSFFFN